MASDLPVGRKELAELARWVPAKEMALLTELCDRANSDPDLLRPAQAEDLGSWPRLAATRLLVEGHLAVVRGNRDAARRA